MLLVPTVFQFVADYVSFMEQWIIKLINLPEANTILNLCKNQILISTKSMALDDCVIEWNSYGDCNNIINSSRMFLICQTDNFQNIKIEYNKCCIQ